MRQKMKRLSALVASAIFLSLIKTAFSDVSGTCLPYGMSAVLTKDQLVSHLKNAPHTVSFCKIDGAILGAALDEVRGLPGEKSNELKITNTWIVGPLILKSVISPPLTFSQCIFDSEPDFQGAKFNGGLYVGHSVFFDSAWFQHASFEKYVQFRCVDFYMPVNFRYVQFGSISKEPVTAFFETVNFKSDVDFSDGFANGKVIFDSMRSNENDTSFTTGQPTVFDGNARFSRFSARRCLKFNECEFRGACYLDSVSAAELSAPETDFSGQVVFRDIVGVSRAINVDLWRAHFSEDVNFDRAEINDLKLVETVFKDDVFFTDVRIHGDIEMVYTQLRKGVYLNWNDMFCTSSHSVWSEPKMRFKDLRAVNWANLEDALRRSSNIDAATEAQYNRHVAQNPGSLSRYIWGYGLKPARIFCLLCILLVGFSVLVSIQLSRQGNASPVRKAFLFSVRSSWSIGYVLEQTKGAIWRFFGVCYSVLMLVGLVLWGRAITETIPVLGDLVKKLIP